MNSIRRLVVGGTVAVLTSLPTLADTPAGDRAADSLAPITVRATRLGGETVRLDAPATVATGLGLATRDLPLSVSIVDREAIRLRGHRTALEAANSAVGVTGGTLPGTVPRFAMRGFTDNNVTLLRDGIRQNTMAQSSRPVDAFVLERVEVLKGPASIMYGEGAVAGALNYVSREPRFAPEAEGYLQLGRWDDRRGGLALTGPFADGRAAWQFAASAIDAQGYADRSRTRQYSGSAGLAWRPSDSFSTGLYLDASDEDVDAWFGLPVVYDAVIDTRTGVQSVRRASIATDRLVNARVERDLRRLNYNLADSFTEARNVYARWTVDWRATPTLALRNVAYLATHDVDWRNSENYVWNPAAARVERDLFWIHRDDRIVGTRASLEWSPRESVRLVGGVDASENELFRGTRAPGALPASLVNVSLTAPVPVETPAAFRPFVPQADATIRTLAPFAEALYEPWPGVKLIAGVRHDALDVRRVDFLNPANSVERSYSPTTGRAGAVWSVREGLNLYASYTTAAEPVLQFVSISATQSALSLQRGRQAEVGLKQTLAGGRLDWTLAAYAITKSDLLTTTVIGGQSVSQTVGEQESRGVELAAAWRPLDTLTLEANAAWTDAEFARFAETVAGGVLARDGNVPPNVPTWVGNLFARWEFAPGLAAALGARHVGARYANNANLIRLESYTTLDAAVEYATAAWTLGLRGRNLTDEFYADWAINQGLQQRVGDPRSAELYLQVRW